MIKFEVSIVECEGIIFQISGYNDDAVVRISFGIDKNWQLIAKQITDALNDIMKELNKENK